MPAHKKPRATSRIWKFTLRCPADKMPLAQDTIRSRFLEFVKLRKDVELKERIQRFDVAFTGSPDEGGLAVANGEATLIHTTSVDRVSFPKLRGVVVDALQIGKDSVHLEEMKTVKTREVKAPDEPLVSMPPAPPPPPPTPPTAAAVIEQINTLVESPPEPEPEPEPEIGILLPAEPPPPMPKKAQRTINQVTRANLAAARPPPITLPQSLPLPQPLPPTPTPPLPPATPARLIFGYTHPPAAPSTGPLVFSWRK
jgi:hypothetical protein